MALFLIRHKETGHYWTASKEWTVTRLFAALLSQEQRNRYPLPDGAEFVPFEPNDSELSDVMAMAPTPEEGTD